MNKFSVFIIIVANMISSIGIIQLNKYIYIQRGFPNMALTCFHFLFCFVSLFICNILGVFEFKKVPLMSMVPMSFSFCGFVVLTNYSLQFNSVGTYSCLKALTTPFVIFISIVYYRHRYSMTIMLTVVNG